MADFKPAVLRVAGSSLVVEPSARVRANLKRIGLIVGFAVARVLSAPRVADAR